jgi:hypothetical protein
VKDSFCHPEFWMAETVSLFVGVRIPNTGKICGHLVEATK